MSVDKTFGFGNASPYRSDTFNRNNDYIFGRNGALEIASVENSGLNVVIGDIVFIQNGVIVSKTGSSSVTFPTALPAPFYLTATIPNTLQVDNISWGFVRRPQDMSDNTVLMAEWDGSEWRKPALISFDGVIDHRLTAAIAYQNIGFNTGFRFSPDTGFTQYTITPGQVTDKTGHLTEKLEQSIFNALDPDPEYDRLDAVLWRRWRDDENRIGTMILRPGPTFDGDTLTQAHKTAIGTGTNVNHDPKVLILSNNTMVVMWLEHYGDNGVLTFAKYDTDRTTELVAPTSVATSAREFDAIVDKDDNIMVTYIREDNLYRLKLDEDGGEILAFAAIDGLTNPVIKPVIQTDFLGNFYVMFLYEKAPSEYAPYFLKMNTGGTISTPSKLLINSSSSYGKVHFIVNDDFECFTAYHNESSNTIEYQKLTEVGDQLTSREVISDDTLYGVVTLSGNSRNPIVSGAENNEIYISFEQDKGVGNYGLAIWSTEYPARYGSKALLKDFENSSEDILDHKIALDWNNHGYLMIKVASKLFHYSFLLPFSSSRLLAVFDVNSVATGAFDIAYDKAGSLAQAFANEQSGTSNNGTAIDDIIFGPETYGAENVYIADTEVAIPLADLQALSPEPTFGDTFTVANSTQGNDGTYNIEETRDVVIDGVDYRVLKDSAATYSDEIGTIADAQFTKQSGNILYYAKQTATIEYKAQELKAEELDSDILCVAIRKSDNEFLTWYDTSLQPASVSSIRSETFLTSKGAITFDKDASSGTLTWGQPISIREPFRHNFEIAAGNVTGFIENSVLYTRIPKVVEFVADGDSEGAGTIKVKDVSQFSIGQKVYVGDSDTDGLTITIDNIVSDVLYFVASMALFQTVRGAYVVPAEVSVIMGEQNKGDLKPDSLGFIDTEIFTIAIRANDIVHFRGGSLALDSGEAGHIGDGASDNTLAYIGASGDDDSDPSYSNNFAGADGESLTARNSNLDNVANKEAQNRNVLDFFPDGIAFAWNSTTGKLTWAGGNWILMVPDKGASPGVAHTILTGTKEITLAANQIAYVDINRATGEGDLTVTVVNDNALPLNAANQDHIVIARRYGTDVSIGRFGRFTLASGGSSVLPALNKLIDGGDWSWDLGSNTLAWSSEAQIQIQGLANTVNRIAAGNAVLDADGKVAYVSLNQIAPGGLLSVSVDTIANVASSPNKKIIARRVGDNVLAGHNLLEDGAECKLDLAFSNNMLTMLGLVDNGQTAHNYSSIFYISQATSHEAALGIFDLKLKQIEDLLSGGSDEYTWLADGGTDTFVVGTGGHGDSGLQWSSDNSINDLIVFVDGVKVELHKAGTFPIANGDTDGEFIKASTTSIRLKAALLVGASGGAGRVKVTARPYSIGMSSVIAVKDEGSVVESDTTEFDFVGAGVESTQTAPGKVQVEIPGTDLGYKLYDGTNNTGVTIPANRLVRFLPNGEVELCDNAVSGKKNPMAVTVLEIPNGDTVVDSVAVGYTIPGVLTGLGFGFNERVFLGSDGVMVNEGSIPDTGAPDDAYLQVGEAYGSGAATTDLIWNKQAYDPF